MSDGEVSTSENARVFLVFQCLVTQAHVLTYPKNPNGRDLVKRNEMTPCSLMEVKAFSGPSEDHNPVV